MRFWRGAGPVADLTENKLRDIIINADIKSLLGTTSVPVGISSWRWIFRGSGCE